MSRQQIIFASGADAELPPEEQRDLAVVTMDALRELEAGPPSVFLDQYPVFKRSIRAAALLPPGHVGAASRRRT